MNDEIEEVRSILRILINDLLEEFNTLNTDWFTFELKEEEYKKIEGLEIKRKSIFKAVQKILKDALELTEKEKFSEEDIAKIMGTLLIVKDKQKEIREIFNQEYTKLKPLFTKKTILYDILPNSVATYLIKSLTTKLPKDKLQDIKSDKVNYTVTLNGQIILKYDTKSEEYSIYIDDFKALTKRQSAKIRKTLNFLLIKANEQNFPDAIYFTLEDYMHKTGMKSKDSAYRSLKKELDTLMKIELEGSIKRGKKEVRSTKEYIFTGYDVSYNQCYIKCTPSHVKLLSQYFTLLPAWAGKLSTKAYDMLDYIYYLARQNTDKLIKEGYFNISLEAINEYLGNPKPDETEHHQQLIIEPILNAIDEIEDARENNELRITPFYNFDYKNAHDFLQGYLKIELEPKAIEFLTKSKQLKG